MLDQALIKELCYAVSSSSSFWSSVFPWASSQIRDAWSASAFRPQNVMCVKPYRQGVAEYGCGQCIPCRLNTRRKMTARLMLEALLHESSFFLTLTYDKEHLPSDESVSVRELQLFVKRLRKRVSPVRIRFYGVGEYGDLSWRPHYHLVVFGLPYAAVCSHRRAPCACVVCESWSQGGCHVGFVTEQSAAYIAGYTVKKMTRDDDVRLLGRRPEFARMSLRPGIGAGAAEVLADGARRGVEGFVPNVVRIAQSLWPVGRYIRRKIRAELGMAESERRTNIRGRLAVEESALKLQIELMEKGAREAREERRLQIERNAYARWKINRSKKGL